MLFQFIRVANAVVATQPELAIFAVVRIKRIVSYRAVLDILLVDSQ